VGSGRWAVSRKSQQISNHGIAIVLVLVIVAFAASGTLAQESQGKCSQVKYSERRTGAYQYRLNGIEGQAVYGDASQKGELESAAEVCVALFDRKSRRLVSNVTTESGGQFKFANVAPGKYMLIVSVSALHKINIPVEVAGNSQAQGFKRWGLLLHLRAKEDRKKSFVTPIIQPVLRIELLKLYREDQDIRNEIINSGYDLHDLRRQAFDARMAVIDAASTRRMKEMVRRYGWPGPELVGQDGSGAAFLLVQHSPDLAFQQAMLPLVRRNYESGKLSAWNYALLVDEVLVREGKPQMYGMKLDHWTGKESVLFPILDEANVDKRRAQIGLSPLREYLEFMKRLYFPKQ
jgi:hypothetical protein